MDDARLKADELIVLGKLAAAWNAWVALGGKHPDDNDEFRHAIHRAEHLVACRVARRVDPGVWWQPEERA